MNFFNDIQNAVFNVIAPLSSPSSQLEMAIANGNQQEVQRLAKEVDPATAMSSSNKNMLMIACENGQVEMFQWLRSMYQWDVMAVHTSSGDSLLHMASRAGNLELVKVLIGEGLLASQRNLSRQNPYDVASDKVGLIKQFLLPHVFQGEQKDGSAPKLPHWLEETRSRGAPGFVPEYNGPPPPIAAQSTQQQQGQQPYGQRQPGQQQASTDQYRLPTSYDGFGTSEVRQSGRPMAPTGPPPPTAIMGPTGGVGNNGTSSQQQQQQPQSQPSYGQQVTGGPSPHLRRAYVPFNSATGGVGPAYTAGSNGANTTSRTMRPPSYNSAKLMPGNFSKPMQPQQQLQQQSQQPIQQQQQQQYQQQQQPQQQQQRY